MTCRIFDLAIIMRQAFFVMNHVVGLHTDLWGSSDILCALKAYLKNFTFQLKICINK